MQFKIKTGENNYGFTLLELMITLLIIGIITAFVIPSFSNLQKKQDIMKIKSDLISIQAASRIYKINNTCSDEDIDFDDLETINTALKIKLTPLTKWQNASGSDVPWSYIAYPCRPVDCASISNGLGCSCGVDVISPPLCAGPGGIPDCGY